MVKLTLDNLPNDLKRLDQPPLALYSQGPPLEEFMTRPRLAIVGSRKVTPYGRAVTMQLSSALASRGVVIISGLAFGVDSIAHEACLQAGGLTIAVLPSGLEQIYPVSHSGLARRIVDNNGLLLSEYSGKASPLKHQFIARNRLIAALSDAVLITEAAEKSGSLHTANFALELGKPVLAVPGNITSEMSKGTNNLIKVGAVPVTSTQSILDALNWQTPLVSRQLILDTTEEQTIVDLLSTGLSDGNALLKKSQLEPAVFNQALSLLEIKGIVKPQGANHWSL